MENNVGFVRIRCWRCFRKVEVAMLSDFEYGNLLFQTSDGKRFAHVSLLDNLVFDRVCETVDKVPKRFLRRIDPQHILAILADPVNGQSLSGKLYRCPNCNSKICTPVDNGPLTFRTVPEVRWSRFLELSTTDQDAEIRAAIQRRQ